MSPKRGRPRGKDLCKWTQGADNKTNKMTSQKKTACLKAPMNIANSKDAWSESLQFTSFNQSISCKTWILSMSKKLLTDRLFCRCKRKVREFINCYYLILMRRWLIVSGRRIQIGRLMWGWKYLCSLERNLMQVSMWGLTLIKCWTKLANILK